MPSGKRARQQRQQAAAAAPPPVRSKGLGGTRARQASPRALAIAGVVALAIVVAIVLGVVLSGGSGGGGGGGVVSSSDMQDLPSTTGSHSWAGSLPGAPDANNLFKGIPQHGLTLGDPKAPVEMEMFIDVQCPICQDYEVNHLPTVVNKYIKTGKVQLRLKPWAFISDQSFTGRLGLIAAADQNKAFEYSKVLYDNQPPNSERTGYLTGRWMAQIAASVNGLNLAQWRDDTNGSAAQATAKSVDKLATQIKASGTPYILVGPTNGKLQVASGSSYDPTGVDQALAAAVAQS
jgi:protein-disulfide isomerase